MTGTLIFAAAIAAGLSPSAAVAGNGGEHAIRCAAANAVVAAMLESGAPSADDLANAAYFRAREADWFARAKNAGVPQARATGVLDHDTQALSADVMASGAADAAQALLEARLGECDEPDKADAGNGGSAAMGTKAA